MITMIFEAMLSKNWFNVFYVGNRHFSSAAPSANNAKN